MKVLFALSLVLFATVSLSQRFPPFRNCDPASTFQFGVIEFDHDPIVQDTHPNYIFFAGHFPTKFNYGNVEYDLFLNGVHLLNGAGINSTSQTFQYNSGSAELILPTLPQAGDYELLLKINDSSDEEMGCAGLMFSVEN